MLVSTVASIAWQLNLYFVKPFPVVSHRDERDTLACRLLHGRIFMKTEVAELRNSSVAATMLVTASDRCGKLREHSGCEFYGIPAVECS